MTNEELLEIEASISYLTTATRLRVSQDVQRLASNYMREVDAKSNDDASVGELVGLWQTGVAANLLYTLSFSLLPGEHSKVEALFNLENDT